MNAERRLPDYVKHMLEAATQATAYVQGMDKSAFMADRRTQQAVLMNIVILGEAAGQVLADYPDFVGQQPDVPWRSIRGMRNRVAHAYFDINLDLVWETLAVDLPELARRLPVVLDAARRP